MTSLKVWRSRFRAGVAKLHPRKGMPYFYANSLRGLRAWARIRGRRSKSADGDLNMTSDGVVVVTHWRRPLMPHGRGGRDRFVDPERELGRMTPVDAMTWAQVARLVSLSGGFRISRVETYLEECGKLGIVPILEPKTADLRWRRVELWERIVAHGRAHGVPRIGGYTLPGNRAAVPAMRAAGIDAHVL